MKMKKMGVVENSTISMSCRVWMRVEVEEKMMDDN